MALRTQITGILNRLVGEGEGEDAEGGSARAPAQAHVNPHGGNGDHRMTTQADIQFRVLNYPDTDPVVALVFVRDGNPLPPNGRVFTLELSPGTTQLEANTLVSLLNRRVVRLVETRAAPSARVEEAEAGPVASVGS